VTLLDSNILLRYIRRTDPAHPMVLAAIAAVEPSVKDVCIVRQNLYEFWVAASRPASANGLGLTTAECQQTIAELRQAFTLLADPPDLLDRWLTLVVAHQCRGKVAHDARLVAALQAHGVNRLLTLNPADFRRFPGLTVLTPADVLAPPPP
jgi:predicted nucleic acid-binding protein